MTHISNLLPTAIATLMASKARQRPARPDYHGDTPCLPPEAWTALNERLRPQHGHPGGMRADHYPEGMRRLNERIKARNTVRV